MRLKHLYVCSSNSDEAIWLLSDHSLYSVPNALSDLYSDLKLLPPRRRCRCCLGSQSPVVVPPSKSNFDINSILTPNHSIHNSLLHVVDITIRLCTSSTFNTRLLHIATSTFIRPTSARQTREIRKDGQH